jgi:hypothetical protein
MVKHPEELGFRLGLKVCIGEPCSEPTYTDDAKTVRDVVYVALLTENSGPLKKGDALKIGQTGGTLKERWDGIIGIFRGAEDRLPPNVQHDRERWVEVAKGKEVSVWMREAGKVEIPYANGLIPGEFSSRGAEEEFLDEYYEPKLGKRLNGRQQRKPIKLPDSNYATTD